MSKFTFILLLMFLITTVSFSQEQPVSSVSSKIFKHNPIVFDGGEEVYTKSNVTLQKVLNILSNEERINSVIEFEYDNNHYSSTLKTIENYWNNGKYDEAINLFNSLDASKTSGVSICINWKNPILTTESLNWGTDVRIGNRDSITVVSMAYHKGTGNLFSVLSYREADIYRYSVNMSTDNGNSWVETNVYGAGSSPVVTVSAAVVDSFCYVGYTLEGLTVSRLRRYSAYTGETTPFIDNVSFKNVVNLGATDAVEEISLATNQENFNNRLYYSVITQSDSLIVLWNNEANVIYNTFSGALADAEEGLDICWNTDYTSYYLYGSYITNSNAIKFFKIDASSSIIESGSYYSGDVRDYSSISAYKDTITSVFEYNSFTTQFNRYLVSYNAGTNWLSGLVGDTLELSEAPNIAAGGGNVGVVFRYYTPTREGRFITRPMHGGWSSPVAYSDNEPFYNKPALEYIGNNKFGCVYLSWFTPVTRGAYFDMNDMAVGLENQSDDIPSDYVLSQNYPNPFNPSTTIRFSIPEQTNVTLKIFNSIGQEVASLLNGEIAAGNHSVDFNASKLSSGVYFYRIDSPSFTSTKKMILIK
jgi:hypothetical protein